jgi:hypothetical protein
MVLIRGCVKCVFYTWVDDNVQNLKFCCCREACEGNRLVLYFFILLIVVVFWISHFRDGTNFIPRYVYGLLWDRNDIKWIL